MADNNHPLAPEGHKPIPGVEPYKGWYYLWKYLPSVPAAAVTAACFLVVTLLICYKTWRARLWYCFIFAVGGLLEIIGYITRIVAKDNTASVFAFSLQTITILLAPILFAASIYMTLKRVVRVLGTSAEKLVPVRAKWLTFIFVVGDITALLIQGMGSGLMIMVDHVERGQKMVVGGLAFHIVVFVIFITVAAIFHRRTRRAALVLPSESVGVRWERIMMMLYCCSVLITIRSIFRMIEFIMGDDGYLLSVEWPLYVFDTVPMWMVGVLFWWFFPGGLAVRVTEMGMTSLRSTE